MLITSLVGGCAAGAEPAPPGDASVAAATDDAPDAAAAADDRPLGTDPDVSDPAPDPARPPDGTTDHAAVRIGDLDTDPARIAAVRADPTLQGATDTALLYLAGWLRGINTGDSALLTELSTPDCQYCASTVARLAADPRTTADGFTTQMTATLLGTKAPDADHAYAVVGLGVRVDSAHVTETDGIPVMQMLEPMNVGFRFAVAGTESGWTVDGIANEEWDGAA